MPATETQLRQTSKLESVAGASRNIFKFIHGR